MTFDEEIYEEMDVNLTTKLPRGFVVSSVTPQAQPDECCSREFMDMRWSVGPSQRIQEHGIIFTRLENRDGKYSVCVTVDGQRIHRVIGYESDGTTRTQAEEFLSKTKTEAKEQRLNLPKGRKLPVSFSEAVKKYLERMKHEKDYLPPEVREYKNRSSKNRELSHGEWTPETAKLKNGEK